MKATPAIIQKSQMIEIEFIFIYISSNATTQESEQYNHAKLIDSNSVSVLPGGHLTPPHFFVVIRPLVGNVWVEIRVFFALRTPIVESGQIRFLLFFRQALFLIFSPVPQLFLVILMDSLNK